MPQIKVNEIDASVVSRVVSGSRATIFCPIIASFGPGYDGTQGSIGKFTDITAFDRAYGYTNAQYNPFKNDYSRMYARELIKKGAEVAVVRLNNNGATASFELDGQLDRTNAPSFFTIAPAVWYNPELLSNIEEKTGATISKYTFPGTIRGTATVSSAEVAIFDDGVVDTSGNGKLYYDNAGTKTEIGTVKYDTGDTNLSGASNPNFTYKYLKNGEEINTANGWYKYTFCPQIAGIEAKYAGSFGNNILISISQVNTSRLSESYQYAVISVYYIDREVNYGIDANGKSYVKSQIVKSTTLLENKRISTNPNSPDYFEDVEFDFIRIIPTNNARDELALVWNDIESGPDSNRRYAGFPVIPLRYKDAQGYTTQYNFAALFDKTFGTDFAYSEDVINLLRQGYVDYWNVAQTSGVAWTVTDVNKYMKDVYGDASTGTVGIIQGTFAALADTYQHFSDPYMYDFDFITSSGFTYAEYELEQPTKEATESTTKSEATPNTALPDADLPISAGSVVLTATGDSDFGTKTYNDNGAGGLYLSTDGTKEVVATIDYTNGKFTAITDATGYTLVYKKIVPDTSKPLVANLTYPESSGDGYYAIYTSVTPIHVAMRNLVETRQDCVALFDVPRDYDKQMIVEYSRMLNTSYGAIHNPWCYVKSPDVYGKLILMAPSYIFLYTYMSNLINNVESQKWFPPAGVERATAKVVVKPDYEIGAVILDEWQNANTARVNPIMRLKQYGYVIYGQYTTLEAIDQYTHSALESLNVRLIANVVKREIFDACLNLAFDPNDESLWLKFFDRMDRFLRYMKYNGGLYAYKIVMDESTVTTDDINHLRCPGKVMIAPTRTAEFFDIDFTITDAGVTFDE